jgi:hypothetical protein
MYFRNFVYLINEIALEWKSDLYVLKMSTFETQKPGIPNSISLINDPILYSLWELS